MSAITLARGPITTHLLAALRDGTVFPVGDAAPPTEPHGWQGEPNAAGTNFIPWLSFTSGTASVSGGTLGASASEWRAIYYLTTAGVTRSQTDGVADLARGLVVATERSNIAAGGLSWRILQVRTTSIGGVVRVSSANPAYFVQTDTLEVWLSKEN